MVGCGVGCSGTDIGLDLTEAGHGRFYAPLPNHDELSGRLGLVWSILSPPYADRSGYAFLTGFFSL